MENTARYTLIGLFTLACLFASFAFVYWIKNVGGLGERAIYTVRFEQPVSGLTEGASVLFNGIRAGAVSRIALDSGDPKRVTATISLDPAVPVRADTQVDIAYLGLTGAAAVSLKGGSREAPRLMPRNGQPPEIVAGVGAGRTLSESAQDTLRHIDDIMNQNATPLNTAITGIATFADMLGRNAPRVEGLIGGLEKLTGTGAPTKGPSVYDLTAANNFPAGEKKIAQQLVVPDPNVLLLFDSQKILTRAGDGTYGNITNAQWADNLPKLVEARLVQSFENARQLNMVSRPIDSLNPAFRLETTIRSFYIASEATPQAVVAVTARLVSDKGDVAAARVFNATVRAKSIEAPDAVAALNEAFTKVAGEMVTWTVDSI